MKPERQHIFDDPDTVRRLRRFFYVICGLLLAADFVYHRHAAHPWESLWGFYGLYGFVACVALVLIAKQLRKILMRREDYYDR
ncbi:MAG: hypothetical protein PVI91_16095 [Gammaproteobacteria bacterium]|jgi:hypothetical protein